MIYFSVPDYTWLSGLYLFFQDLYQVLPEWFLPNRMIESVYGLPGQLIWGGGRHIQPMNHHEAQLRVNDLRSKNLKIKHVCTNKLLSSYHFLDSACNQWLKNNEYLGDAVIVYDYKLGEYIKEHYPKYDIIISTTRGRMTPKEHSQLHSLGYGSVLYYSDIYNDDIISKIECPEKIEIIAGEECEPNCPYRNLHYDIESRIALGIDTPEDNKWVCPQDRRNNFWADIASPRESTLTNERIDELYYNYGINHIKLSGRDQPKWAVFETLLYYLIKPEYQNIVRSDAKLLITDL